MSTTPPQYFDLIESALAGNKNDFRVLLQQLSANDTRQQAALGLASSTTTKNAATPPAAALSASGSNGAFNLTVTPAPTTQPGPVWHEISSSPVKGFTSGVLIEALTTAANLVVNRPGVGLFFRVRSSYNKTVFNQPTLHGQTAVSSGLVSSAATESAAAFNQTNLGVVNSTAVGTSAAVTVSGASSTLSAVPTIKGAAQSVAPPATILGATPGSTQYVGYSQSHGSYVMGTELPDVFDDDYTPIGKVSVVETGTPALPAISLVLGSGGSVIAWNVTNGGVGITGPLDLSIITGTGSGATPGAQTIEGGSLISVAPGNPGSAYAGGDTVDVSGGIGGGTSGGGTAEGNTNGRLTT